MFQTIGSDQTSVSKPCAESVTPACLQKAYGIPTSPGPSSKSEIAISGFIDQFANLADLKVSDRSVVSARSDSYDNIPDFLGGF